MENLIPIFICCVMPVSIVLIVCISEVIKGRQRTEIIKKAIESNVNVDMEKMIESYSKPQRTPLENMSRKLLRGWIFSIIGLGFIATGLISLCTGSVFSDDSVTFPMLIGFVSLAVGTGFIIVYIMIKKQLKIEESAADKADDNKML